MSDVPAGMLWDGASAGRLQVVFPGNDYSASWQFNRCVCGDVLINSDSSLPGDNRQGDMLLVGGRAVVYRGFDSDRPEEVMSIDAPALMMRLVFQLLAQARPQGPSAITSKELIAVAGVDEPVTVDSGQAVGSFFPPWTVKGTLIRQGEAVVQYDLNFTFNVTPPGGGEEHITGMALSGHIDYIPADFPIDNETPLADLRLVWRDNNDPARLAGQQVTTLGDLRNLITTHPW